MQCVSVQERAKLQAEVQAIPAEDPASRQQEGEAASFIAGLEEKLKLKTAEAQVRPVATPGHACA